MTADATPRARAAKPPPPLPAGCHALLEPSQVALALGVTRRHLERMISTGDYPRPDTYIGRLPRWTVETHNKWLISKCNGKDGADERR